MFRKLVAALVAFWWKAERLVLPVYPAPGLRSCHRCGRAVFRRCVMCCPPQPVTESEMSELKPCSIEWTKSAAPPPSFRPLAPLGVDWTAEDVAKCLAVFWNLGLTNPADPGQRMEQDGATITLLDTAGKPQRFRLVREFPELGSDS